MELKLRNRPATLVGTCLALFILANSTSSNAAESGQYVLHVGVVKAAEEKVRTPLRVTGVVAANESRDLSFRVGGTVVERSVQAGDKVRAGQVLARLGTTELQANITAAKADVASAKASLDLASSDLARQKSLLDKGFTTRSSYDQAAKTMEVAQAQLNIAQSQLQIAEDNISYTELKAGADGVVIAVSIEVGQVVQAGQTAVTIAAGGGRQAVFDISEATIAKAALGNPKVVLASDPTVVAKAQFAEISPTVNSRTGTVRIKVDLIDPPERMSLGATVIGEGESVATQGFLLPYSALTRVGGKPAVWVVDPKTKKAAARPIEPLEYIGQSMLISGGLNEGDLVVSQGTAFLSPDLVVTYSEGAQ